MPRKGTLEQQRERYDRRYRGRKATREISSDESIADFDREMRQLRLVYLKAAGFNNTYCADALGVSTSTITSWLADEELSLKDSIRQTSAKMLDHGIKLIDSYLLEIIEMQMEIARTTESDDLASRIGFELLDRRGIVKVNKSEAVSATTHRQEIGITDTTGLLAIAKGAPPEVQAAMAESAERIVALAQEHGEPQPS